MCRMLDKVDRRRPSLYCILFGFVTFVRLRSRGPAQRRSPRRPVGLASQVLWRETGACASPCDRSIDCCELGRKRHARYKMAGILHVQAPAEVAHSHGMYRRPSTKQRAPGSWCDWGGLSHSGDPHTTMYRLSLPSVEHAGCAELHTRQSRTGLATEERQPSEPWSKLKHMPLPRNSAWEAGYTGLRGGPTDDGSREERPVECRAARDYLVTLIMQKLAVEWRSTLSSMGHSRVPVDWRSTLYALPRSTRLYTRRV